MIRGEFQTDQRSEAAAKNECRVGEKCGKQVRCVGGVCRNLMTYRLLGNLSKEDVRRMRQLLEDCLVGLEKREPETDFAS